MNGPEHYKAAERDLTVANDTLLDDPYLGFLLDRAQVHATLALAAATEQRQGFTLTDDDVMRCAHGAVICGICGYGAPMGGLS